MQVGIVRFSPTQGTDANLNEFVFETTTITHVSISTLLILISANYNARTNLVAKTSVGEMYSQNFSRRNGVAKIWSSKSSR